jgi:hypothetical protein
MGERSPGVVVGARMAYDVGGELGSQERVLAGGRLGQASQTSGSIHHRFLGAGWGESGQVSNEQVARKRSS